MRTARAADDAGLPDLESPAESRRRHATRERLMDAALVVFSEIGIGSASVELITDRAGFTRGAFYSNFSSKEELFVAVMKRATREFVADLNERLDRLLPQIGSAPLSAEQIGELVVAVLESHGNAREHVLLETEFRLLAVRDPQLAPRYAEYDDACNAQLFELLEFAAPRVGRRLVSREPWVAHALRAAYDNAALAALTAGDPVEVIAERVREPIAAVLQAVTAAE